MAKKRQTPSTPFGAWLDAWLDEHREWTLAALGEEIARRSGRKHPVTDGAISQWLSGATRRIAHQNLVGLAAVTGEPIANLEALVYGSSLTARTVTATSDPDRLWAEVLALRGAIEQLRADLADLDVPRRPRSGGATPPTSPLDGVASDAEALAQREMEPGEEAGPAAAPRLQVVPRTPPARKRP